MEKQKIESLLRMLCLAEFAEKYFYIWEKNSMFNRENHLIGHTCPDTNAHKQWIDGINFDFCSHLWGNMVLFHVVKDQLLVHLNKIHLGWARQVKMRLESLWLVLNAGYMLKSLGFFSVVYFLYSWKMKTRKKKSVSFVKILFFRLCCLFLKQ